MSLTFDEAAKWLLLRNNFLIINHIRPDGDAHGSAAALAQGLRECGKVAYILENPDSTDKFKPYVEPYYPLDDFAPSYYITVDTASTNMLSKSAALFADCIDLSIDHHPSNSGYAKELCLDGAMSSCGEVVYEILTRLPCGVSKTSASAIYMAVATDTGCFAFANTTSNTFRVAGEAASLGAPIAEQNRVFFRTKSKGRLQLEGEIFSNISFYFEDQVAVITITRAMMAKYGVTENDMDDIAAIPGGVEGVKVGITIRELAEPGKCKVSVRSGPMFDSNALCRRFGGGGHFMAAGLSYETDVDTMRSMLLDALKETFDR